VSELVVALVDNLVAVGELVVLFLPGDDPSVLSRVVVDFPTLFSLH
jgi:hypothetical protein